MRKKFLVKPSLQIRHLLWTLGMIVLSCGVGYLLFESMAFKIFQTLNVPSAVWDPLQTVSRLGFILILLILLIAVGIENYLLFHKFVGPLYALEKGLKRIAEGDLASSIQIRDTDELGELVEAFEKMRKEIQSKLSSQKILSEMLKKDVDNMIQVTSQNNLAELQTQLLKLKHQINKEHAS